MRIYLMVFLCFLLSPILLYSRELYTSSLKLKNIENNYVIFEWRANTNQGRFQIFSNLKESIRFINVLEQSEILFDGELIGNGKTKMFNYKHQIQISNAGEYYFIVLPYFDNYKQEDILVNINNNLKPIIIKDSLKEEVTNKKEEITKDIKKEESKEESKNIIRSSIKDIHKDIQNNPYAIYRESNLSIYHVKTYINDNIITVYWSLANQLKKDYIFEIYKTDKFIYTLNDLKEFRPYKIVKNEFFIEDKINTDGKDYYYTVIIQGDNRFYPGKNNHLKPVKSIVNNEKIIVEKEEIKTNIIWIEYRDQKEERDPQLRTQKIKEITITNYLESQKNIEDNSKVLNERGKPEYRRNREMIQRNQINSRKKQKNVNEEIDILNEVPKKHEEKKHKEIEIITNFVYITNKTECFIEEEFIHERNENTQNMNVRYKETILKNNEEIIYPTNIRKRESIDIRTNNTKVNNNLKKGIEYYQKGNYEEALSYFKKEQNENYLYYLGKTLYYLERYQEAYLVFKKLYKFNALKAEMWLKLVINRIGE